MTEVYVMKINDIDWSKVPDILAKEQVRLLCHIRPYAEFGRSFPFSRLSGRCTRYGSSGFQVLGGKRIGFLKGMVMEREKDPVSESAAGKSGIR